MLYMKWGKDFLKSGYMIDLLFLLVKKGISIEANSNRPAKLLNQLLRDIILS